MGRDVLATRTDGNGTPTTPAPPTSHPHGDQDGNEAYFLDAALERRATSGRTMDITRVSRDGNSLRTTMPRPIHRALGLNSGDYVVWTWNTKGYAEVRLIQHPTRQESPAPKKR